jgi:hypothetical protein
MTQDQVSKGSWTVTKENRGSFTVTMEDDCARIVVTAEHGGDPYEAVMSLRDALSYALDRLRSADVSAIVEYCRHGRTEA